eukprot:6455533-Amphidinium_carterae.1
MFFLITTQDKFPWITNPPAQCLQKEKPSINTKIREVGTDDLIKVLSSMKLMLNVSIVTDKWEGCAGRTTFLTWRALSAAPYRCGGNLALSASVTLLWPPLLQAGLFKVCAHSVLCQGKEIDLSHDVTTR